jgi:hypothetical protein
MAAYDVNFSIGDGPRSGSIAGGHHGTREGNPYCGAHWPTRRFTLDVSSEIMPA